MDRLMGGKSDKQDGTDLGHQKEKFYDGSEVRKLLLWTKLPKEAH